MVEYGIYSENYSINAREKKMKKYLSILIIFLSLCLALALCSCNGDVGGDDVIPEVMPTANEVVLARANAVADTQQNYDFNINLAGNVNVYGISGTANANYDGKYRYNSSTGELKFKRITSGALLYDAVEYIYNVGSSKIKLVANQDGTVKRTSIVTQEEEELNLINIPFVAIIDALSAENISTITKTSSGQYEYVTKIALSSSNAKVQTIIDILGKLGTTLEMGDVSFTNPASGVDFYFNLNDDKKLNDFMFSAEISFPIKDVDVSLTLTYSQKASNTPIVIPSLEGLITNNDEISSEMNTINGAITALKNSGTYSLDFEAINEFDPAWNVNAITDKYNARLYKNTNGDRVDFNHSYEYKAHTEEEGAETYKYTIANIRNGSVYQVSRKGTNVITEVTGVTVDTQFDYLFNAAMVNIDNIDCIKKVINGNTTIYRLYINKTETLSVQDKIIDIINSNEATGVIDVDNYFNSSKNMIKESEIVIEMKANAITKIEVTTEIRYNPTGGEYTERQITLTNSIVLEINKKLTDAQKYKAPETTETTNMLNPGLNNAKYYIG